MSDGPNARPRQASRPEHSEAYWRAMKYIILALGGLMLIAIGVAAFVIVRFAV